MDLKLYMVAKNLELHKRFFWTVTADVSVQDGLMRLT